jgi:hypothetical protein
VIRGASGHRNSQSAGLPRQGWGLSPTFRVEADINQYKSK